MSAKNGKTISGEKLNEIVSLLTVDDPDLAQEWAQMTQSEAVTASLLLGVVANTLGNTSSLDSVRNLRGKELVLFVRELIKVSQATLLACEGIQGLKEKIGSTQTEISELEDSISQVLEENKAIEEQLQQRMKDVDILFEKNSQLKSLLDVYANVNIYVARSLPGRFHSLTTKLNGIEQELQQVDAGLRSAIEEHQETKLLLVREA
jgi:TolA-binding protein